jgi:hypothetical protein
MQGFLRNKGTAEKVIKIMPNTNSDSSIENCNELALLD